MNNLSNSIAISGASGWLGRETIEVLEDIPSHEMTLFTSNGRDLLIKNEKKLLSKNFLTSSSPPALDGFIHLAFLTRDKVEEVGSKEFIAINMSLISKACQFIETSKPKWVVIVSSGAILDRKSGNLESNIETNPYGFCKRVEEILVTQSAQKVGANVVIGRLWGASGNHMPLNDAYALSDFIVSAHRDKKITIKSGGKVFRRYVDAGEFMKVLIKSAILGDSLTVNSGGPRVEIGELATLVASHFNGTVIERSSTEVATDDYFPRGDEFEVTASFLGVTLSDMKTQVSQTVEGHQSSFIE